MGGSNRGVGTNGADWPDLRAVFAQPLPIGQPSDVVEQSLAAPTCAGVVAFETGEGGVVQIVATANVREAIRRRLGASDDEETTRRTDLRGVVERVRWITAGSNLERDVLFLEAARELAEATHREACRQWQGWFLHIDPEEAFPRWTKIALPGWLATKGGAAPPERGRLIGPFRDKHAAQKAAETLDDLFDLCRYHHILVQAPHGLACAYKEMGKCPAPCDGSEEMEAYRERVAEAADFAAGPASRRLQEMEEAMQEAAEARDFEKAAALKDRVARAKALRSRSCAWCGDLASLAVVAVGPAERSGWSRVMLFARGEVFSVADIADGADERAVEEAAERVRTIASSVGPCRLTDPQQERIGLLCSALYGLHEKGPRGSTMMLVEEMDPESLRRAVRKAANRRKRSRASEEDDRELGGEQA